MLRPLGLVVALAVLAGDAHAATLARWRPALHVAQVVDVVGPRADGRLAVAADGRLSLLRPPGAVTPFARAPGGYSTQPGSEAYIAHSPGLAVRGTCRFPRDATYALEPAGRPGVIAVDRGGRARRLLDLPPSAGLPSGIAFDTMGRFGHRLLVTATASGRTTLSAVDCRGRARTLTTTGPGVEGGMAVAPEGFGRFAGRLVAPDELSGRLVAFTPDGRATVLATSGLPTGGDIGVESAGFVPAGFDARWSAYLADRATPGNPHPGSDAVLTLSGRSLLRAGVRAGDLLVATEAGAQTIAVRCRKRCSVRHVADGPAVAHAEGHIAFALRG